MQKKVIITGYGGVAKEFCQLILEHSESLKKRYGFDIAVSGIVGSKGMLYQSNGINLEALLKNGAGSIALSKYSGTFQLPLIEPNFEADALIECTPTNIDNGEPGLTYILKAIDLEMDVVSVSKGALVHSFHKIKKATKHKGTRLKFSGATAAALPTIDIGEYSLSGCTITKIEGVLNGTSNFVLTSMYENHLSFADALKIAQEKGIAEANPRLDVGGFDSGCKLLLLSNELLGTEYSLADVSIQGIEHLTRGDIEDSISRECQLKLLVRAYKKDERVFLEVKPVELHAGHPLYHVHGTNKGILFETKEMGTICTTGGASHPRGAAAAALKDLINLYRNDH